MILYLGKGFRDHNHSFMDTSDKPCAAGVSNSPTHSSVAELGALKFVCQLFANVCLGFVI